MLFKYPSLILRHPKADATNDIMIGFIVPTKKEAQPLLEQFSNCTKKNIENRTIYLANLGPYKCSLILCGIGAQKCIISSKLFINHLKFDYIINLGTTGALCDKLSLGDIILANHVVEQQSQKHFQCSPGIPKKELITQFANRKNLKIVNGKIITADQDIVTSKQKLDLINTSKDLLSVDRESFWIGKSCVENNIPFSILRIVSDHADEGALPQYFERVLPLSKKLSHLILSYIIGHQ